MKVLVTYATRHGATAGIATRIAETLTASGHDATAEPVEGVTDIAGYQAVVLGGAAYMSRWLTPAVRFARRHHADLATRPVWLFSSGPLGTDQAATLKARTFASRHGPRNGNNSSRCSAPEASTCSLAHTTRQRPHSASARS